MTILCNFFRGFYKMYSSQDDVIELTASNFEKLVYQSNAIWIVEFYAPWCGYCRELRSEYIQLATNMKGIAKVGAVNIVKEDVLSARYHIHSIPKIIIFGVNKSLPIHYKGSHTANGIAEAAFIEVNNKVGVTVWLVLVRIFFHNSCTVVRSSPLLFGIPFDE